MKLYSNAEINGLEEPRILRLTDKSDLHHARRSTEGLLINSEILDVNIPDGFGAYVFKNGVKKPESRPTVGLPDELNYLQPEDIIRINPLKQKVNVIYRRNSSHNSFLLTERCNSKCLMCSQPPRDIDDSHIVNELLEVIPLVNPATESIGFTGGETTIIGDGFIALVESMKDRLPETSLHVLSNGRYQSDINLTNRIASVGHPDITFGIPLYSALPDVHNFVVQADNAYDETIRGILNLARYNISIEIRVVIHNLTYKGLPQLAEFIVRNLPFVDHVALMGLEMMGFTKSNLDVLWVDPYDYQNELVSACKILDQRNVNFSIYNHQLCLLHPDIRKYAVKSISDWKNIYMPECKGCHLKNECGGFFASAKLKYSDHITPELEVSCS